MENTFCHGWKVFFFNFPTLYPTPNYKKYGDWKKKCRENVWILCIIGVYFCEKKYGRKEYEFTKEHYEKKNNCYYNAHNY